MPRTSSAQLKISMPNTLVDRIKKAARDDNRTVSNWISVVVERKLDTLDEEESK